MLHVKINAPRYTENCRSLQYIISPTFADWQAGATLAVTWQQATAESVLTLKMSETRSRKVTKIMTELQPLHRYWIELERSRRRPMQRRRRSAKRNRSSLGVDSCHRDSTAANRLTSKYSAGAHIWASDRSQPADPWSWSSERCSGALDAEIRRRLRETATSRTWDMRQWPSPNDWLRPDSAPAHPRSSCVLPLHTHHTTNQWINRSNNAILAIVMNSFSNMLRVAIRFAVVD